MRVNLSEVLATLMFCPVCGKPLVDHPHFTQQRSCLDHGDFMIESIGPDGSVDFTFCTMPTALPVHRDNIETR
jgi:hypothetical protein